MARKRAKRSSRRSNSSRLFKKRSPCPTSIKRTCKMVSAKAGRKGKVLHGATKQVCQVVAGSYKSKWFSAGVAQRRALNLKARLAKVKGCAPAIAATSLGRYKRRSK